MKKKILLYMILVFTAGTVLSCSGDSFEQYKKDRIVEDNSPIPDTTPPDIESLSVISGSEIKIVFSEEIDPVSASVTGNYYIQGVNRVSVIAAEVQSDNKSVVLSLTNSALYRMRNGKEYTLLVQRVSDVKSNKILNAFTTFIGKGLVVAEIFNGTDAMPLESPYPSYNNSYAEFVVAGADISSYQFSLDESAWSSEQPVATKLTISGLAEGFHSLRVIGKSSVSGEWQDVNQPTTAYFTVDTTPPLAVLQHLPMSVTDLSEIDVVVSGAGVETYRYKINSGSWSDDIPATKRITKDSLPEGGYTLYVIGKDIAGNEQTAATEHSWSINSSSSIAMFVNAPDKFTRQKNFSIGVNGNNVNFFKYRINGGSWTEKFDTGEVVTLYNIPDGSYTLEIIGSSGISDDTNGPVTSYSWTVDSVAPVSTVSNLTSNPTSSQSTHFTVGSAAGDVVGYRYKINSEALSGVYSVDSPVEITSLPEGTYTIKIMGIDAAGNMQSESSATTWTWTVDLTPPHASLSGLPAAIGSNKNLDVTVNGTGSVAYKYQLDNMPWSSELSVSLPIEFFSLDEGYHTIYIITRDQAGNWQTVQNATTHTWIIDTLPPAAVLTDKPALITNIQTADITVSGVGVAKYKYRFDGSAWSIEYDRINYPSIPLGSPVVLTEGTHTLEVLAVDSAGNWQISPTSYSWTINTIIPTAQLVNTPGEFSKLASIDITVQGVDAYKYKLDNEMWSAEVPASTHIIRSGLNEGFHTLLVMGKNTASGMWQAESSATGVEWTVDVSAPTVELWNKPASLTNSQSASFTVSGVGIYAYRYSVDNATAFGSEVLLADDSTIDIINLSGESHTVYVIGRDEAGNWQSVPTTYTWVVNTEVPSASFSNLPASLTNQTIFNVTVGGFDVVSYKYSYDGSDWSPELAVSTVISRVGVTAQTHTLRVIGKNSAGTWQPESSPASYTWTVNISAPSASDIILSNLPNDPTSDTSVSINVGGTGITAYQYKVNNNSWSAEIDKSLPITLTGLENNTFTLYVVAKNSVGNWLDRSQAKEFSWRVDTSSPLATITNRPENPTGSNSASFDVGGAEIVRYKYKLNSGEWSAWRDATANINLNSLADGSYMVSVCGSKVAGYTGAAYNSATTQADVNATTYTWVVDTVAPIAVLSNLPVDYTTSTSTLIRVSGIGVVAYQYRVDGGSWLPAASDKSVNFDLILSDLPVTTHTIEVRGRDEAGNWQTASSAHTWIIDYPPLASPAVFDAGTTTTKANIQFGWINPGGTGSVKMQVATDSDFTNIIFHEVIGTASPYNFIITSPNYQKYYARVSVNANSTATAGGTGWTVPGAASDGIDVVGGIGGRIKNVVGLAPISGAIVSVKRMDNNLLITSSQTDGNGDFSITDIPIGMGIYKLEVTYSGFLGTGKSNVDVIIGEETNVGQMFLVPDNAVNGTISGTSVDANTGFTVGSSIVKIMDWQGDEKGTYTSSATGDFVTGTLNPGVYTLIFSKTGFFNLTVDGVIVNGNKSVGRQAMCQVLVEPQIRFVYQWDEFPSDPDIFMAGPTTTTQADTPVNRFLVRSDHKSFYEGNGTYVGSIEDNGDWYGTSSTTSLVQDAVTGYGPEAINLYRYGGVQYAKGTYSFTVHRFAYNPRALGGNTAVFGIANMSLTNGSNTVTGSVPVDGNYSDRTIRCDVEAGKTLVKPTVNLDDALYYRCNYEISGTGIQAGSYLEWYDRSIRQNHFQMNKPADDTGSFDITISARVEALGFYSGMPVTGTNIPAGTVIQSVINTGGRNFSLVLSNAATATTTGTLTFNPGWGRTSGIVRVYDSESQEKPVRQIIFPADKLSSDDNCWKVLKMDIWGNTRSKRKVIQINEMMQDNTRNKTTMDW